VEVIMTNRLLVVLTAVVIATACDSRPSLTFPTATSGPVPPAPTPTPPPTPGINYQEKGPIPTSATTIAAGQVVAGAIESADPVCFPNWDSTGHCQQYEVTAPLDGSLVAILTWPPGPSRGIYSPELFLVAPDQSWIWADEIFPNRRGSAHVSKGDTYRLVVLSYGPFPDRYELTADVYP
jgi:hypothetical protein